MKSKMISLVVSVFAATALLAATVTVEKPAGDGANTITQEIDLETGDIVSERMTCVHVAPKADAETLKKLRDGIKAELVLDGQDNSEEVRRKEMKEQLDSIREGLRVETKQAKAEADAETVTVYRLQLYKNADGSETAYVVGVDGVERPVVLIDPMEYKMLTERLEIVWQSLHSTSDGRRKLHGKLERTEIDEKERKKVEVYADGYRHTETIPEKRTRPVVVEPKKTRLHTMIEESTGRKPSFLSERQFQMRQKLNERKKGKVKTVTVEHNAVTGTDTVK